MDFQGRSIFSLDRILEGSTIGVISLHLDVGSLHWHKNFIKRRNLEWGEYKEAIRSRFGYYHMMIQGQRYKN